MKCYTAPEIGAALPHPRLMAPGLLSLCLEHPPPQWPRGASHCPAASAQTTPSVKGEAWGVLQNLGSEPNLGAGVCGE